MILGLTSTFGAGYMAAPNVPPPGTPPGEPPYGPDTRIQELIATSTPRGTYNDAIYYTVDEFSRQTRGQINAEKMRRKQAWLDFIAERSNHPPEPPPEPGQR